MSWVKTRDFEPSGEDSRIIKPAARRGAVRRLTATSSPPLTQAELWRQLSTEAYDAAAGEAFLRPFIEQAVSAHPDWTSALAALLARKLGDQTLAAEKLAGLIHEAVGEDPGIIDAAMADLLAIRSRDPAVDGYLTPFLYFKGFHALQLHRVSHWLWRHDRWMLAHFLQSRTSEVFSVDIHPAVPVGRGVFIDHGTGIVVGETAVIGDNVSMLQEVTLGGTGKERGDRHPKVCEGVLLSAGAKVLGNIVIGKDAKVGAGSVVLHDVPPCATVAGVPARIVGHCGEKVVPALDMDQSLPKKTATRPPTGKIRRRRTG